jgi:hypothetical protein
MDIVKRERYVQKIIRLTPTENNYIKNKMDNAGRKNFNAFALEMLIQGQVNIVDFKSLSDLKIAIDRVGKNVNQIAKKVNESGDVSKNDIDERRKIDNPSIHGKWTKPISKLRDVGIIFIVQLMRTA